MKSFLESALVAMVVIGGTVASIGMSIGIVVAIFCVTAIQTFYLWNWLMPPIFGIPTITFVQAIGLTALCECLFKARSYSFLEEKKK